MRIDDSYAELTQWDTGRKIILDKSETCDQVHFTNRSFGSTIDMKTYQLNDDLVANIPDELLQSSSPLMVYCYVVRKDGESTTIVNEFSIRSRNKPLGYIYDPDDQTRIKELNEFVDNTLKEMNGIKAEVEDTVVHQPKIQNGTWWIWSFDKNDYVDSGVEAQGPQGEQGIKGETGDKGDSALINGVPTITIKGGTNIALEQTGTDLTINNTQKILMDFPDYIVTNGTMQDLLNSLDDNNLPTGNIYLGGITCSDLPEGLMQAELKIESIKNSDDLSVYYFTITSTDVPPYLWTGTGFGSFSGWQARPTADDVPTKTSDLTNDTHFISETEVETEYVKNTAVATSTKLGLVKVADNSGIELKTDGSICVNAAIEEEIDAKTDTHKPIVPATLDYAVKSVTTDEIKADETAPVSSKAVKVALDETAKTGKNNNFSAAQTINGTLTVNGDIIQNGEAYETHAEQLYTKKDLIKTREGAVGGLGEGELTGIEAEKYDGEHNGRLAFDTNGTARVGDVGDEQPLLTREEVANLIDGQVLIWNGTNLKAVTSDQFVKFTDYATMTKSGVVKVHPGYGLLLGNTGILVIKKADDATIKERINNYNPIVSTNLNAAVKAALSDDNRISDMTDEEKANARGVIGAINEDDLINYVKNTDYATTVKGGVVKILGGTYGIEITSDGALQTVPATNSDIDGKTAQRKPIVPSNLDYAVRSVLPLTSNVIPDTLVVNTEYYLGESTTLSFAFPATGLLGQYCFIKFVSGSTATALTVTGTNYAGDIPIPIANKTYEIIATWNGDVWVCSYRGY